MTRCHSRLYPLCMHSLQQNLPFSEMEAFYRAYSKFVRLTERHQYRIMLQSGDFLVYDNHRMLHARTAFSGPRWLRGIYFECK